MGENSRTFKKRHMRDYCVALSLVNIPMYPYPNSCLMPALLNADSAARNDASTAPYWCVWRAIVDPPTFLIRL